MVATIKFILTIFIISSYIFSIQASQSEYKPNFGRLSKREVTSISKRLVCYFDRNATDRPDQGKLKVDQIDAHLCTHIVYHQAGLNSNGDILYFTPEDCEKCEVELSKDDETLKSLSNLKKVNTNLKVLVSIKGGSFKYGEMVGAPESRANFIKNSINMLEKYNLDGVDLVWRHPNDPRGNLHDKQNYVTLARELKAAFDPKGFLFSITVGSTKRRIEAGYDIVELAKLASFLNLKTYDYSMGWDKKTGLHAPLYSSSKYDLEESDTRLNVNGSVSYILSLGVPAEKLNVGLTTYGRTFKLEQASVNGIEAPISGPGMLGPYTKYDRFLGYNEICASQKEGGWTVVHEPDYKSSYASKDLDWVNYDDKQDLVLKTKFALSKGLGGVTIGFLDTDDFQGTCHGESYPLLKAVKSTLLAIA